MKQAQPNGDTSPLEGIASSDYARSKRELLSLVNEISSSCAQFDIDLPRIAVIGKLRSGSDLSTAAVLNSFCRQAVCWKIQLD